jgi:hypothetical protein
VLLVYLLLIVVSTVLHLGLFMHLVNYLLSVEEVSESLCLVDVLLLLFSLLLELLHESLDCAIVSFLDFSRHAVGVGFLF